MKKNYLKIDVCKECGGKCCKHLPGIAHPCDFKKPLKESLIEAFKSGHWAIDWYEGDPVKGRYKLHNVLFIRPKVKGVSELFDLTWGGECIFLAYDGCTLKPLERPRGCRLLEPISVDRCVPHKVEDKATCARPWMPYQKVILKAARAVGESIKNAHKAEATSLIEQMFGIYRAPL